MNAPHFHQSIPDLKPYMISNLSTPLAFLFNFDFKSINQSINLFKFKRFVSLYRSKFFNESTKSLQCAKTSKLSCPSYREDPGRLLLIPPSQILDLQIAFRFMFCKNLKFLKFVPAWRFLLYFWEILKILSLSSSLHRLLLRECQI